MKARLTRRAVVDIDTILRQTKQQFGSRQFDIYAAIIENGLETVASDPLRPSTLDRSHIIPGLRSFHLELVNKKRRSAAHLLYFGLTTSEAGEPEVLIYRVLHEAMEPTRRLIGALRQ